MPPICSFYAAPPVRSWRVKQPHTLLHVNAARPYVQRHVSCIPTPSTDTRAVLALLPPIRRPPCMQHQSCACLDATSCQTRCFSPSLNGVCSIQVFFAPLAAAAYGGLAAQHLLKVPAELVATHPAASVFGGGLPWLLVRPCVCVSVFCVAEALTNTSHPALLNCS